MREDTRDRIISSYQDEIKRNSVRERDFKALQDTIGDLQRRIRLLDGQLKDGQKDYEDKLNTQNKTITHLQGDIEGFKKNVSDKA